MPPTLEAEQALLAAGHRAIAGIDEVGRGCWAGPVVAAAVVLSQAVLANPALLHGVDDSKRLSAAQRQEAAGRIAALACVGIGAVPAFLVDGLGILPATRLAMELALLALLERPDALLIDAVRLPNIGLPQCSIIRGDSLSLSIAAASVMAKVARDRRMACLNEALPAYGFGTHKGYGTAVHFRALQLHGPCAEHRQSFRPLATFLATGVWPVRQH